MPGAGDLPSSTDLWAISSALVWPHGWGREFSPVTAAAAKLSSIQCCCLSLWPWRWWWPLPGARLPYGLLCAWILPLFCERTPDGSDSKAKFDRYVTAVAGAPQGAQLFCADRHDCLGWCG